MDAAIVDSLEDLGYAGELIDREKLQQAVNDGIKSVAFTELVEWLTKQLATLNNMEDSVRQISETNESDNFLMEVSGFLREYGCPYTCLVEGPINNRLSSSHNCLLLLNYLTCELQTMHILLANKPNSVPSAKLNTLDSTPACLIRQLLITLGFPKPPEGITAFQIFSKVETKISELVNSIESAHMSNPALKASLSAKQWENIQYINDALNADTQLRKKMLQQRLDVTFQSFLWSDSAKKNAEKLKNTFAPFRAELETFSDVTIADLLAAREDILKVEKTSSGASRDKTKCELNKYMIGKVPDRGGRAFEMEPPPPEMPSFQQRSQGPPSNRGGGVERGRGGGGGGGGRGGQRGDRSGGGGNWGQNQAYHKEQSTPGDAFFGGGQQTYGGYNAGYQQSGGYSQGGGYNTGYQQSGGYNQGGGYNTGYQQSGGYNQGGGYNDGGFQGGNRDDQRSNDGYRGRRQGRGRGYH